MSEKIFATLENFPSVLFNSSVSFDGSDFAELVWQKNGDIYTASANGVWNLKLTASCGRTDVQITAKLDKLYKRVAFRYFTIDRIDADHILLQTCFKSSEARDLRNVSEPEAIWGESAVSITRNGVTMQLSTPYHSGFNAKFTCVTGKLKVENCTIPSNIDFYGSTDLTLPVLSVREGDGYQMLESYGSENAPAGKEFKDPVCGWNSWDYYRWTITEEEVLKNAEFIKKDPVLSKYVKRIIIDDGWQYCYGEWDANKYFPSGMEYLAKEIRKMGFIPGLWIAPGIVEPHARIAQMDSDMLSMSVGGQPCMVYQCMKRYGFVLDPTNPKCQKFWEDLFRRYADYGYGYFKLDFLRAITDAPRRQDSLVRRDDILRLVIDSIRRGVGNRAELMGCGYVYSSGGEELEAVRVGGDIHAKWDCLKRNTPVVAARYWQHRKLWLNDPDFAVCRAAHTSNDPDLTRLQALYVYVKPEDEFLEDKIHDLATFKENEPEVLLSVVIISGGVTNLSDNMPLLNEKGLELARKTIAAEPGEAGVALDLFSSELPAKYVQKFKSGIRLLAINWSDDKNDTFSFDLEKCGISSGMDAVDFWSGEKVAHDGKQLQFELAPHTCKLIEFR